MFVIISGDPTTKWGPNIVFHTSHANAKLLGEYFVQWDYALAKVEPDAHKNIYSNTVIFDAEQVVEHPTEELDALAESAKRIGSPSNDDSEPVQQMHRPPDFPEGLAHRGRDVASTLADSRDSEYVSLMQVYPRPIS